MRNIELAFYRGSCTTRGWQLGRLEEEAGVPFQGIESPRKRLKGNHRCQRLLRWEQNSVDVDNPAGAIIMVCNVQTQEFHHVVDDEIDHRNVPLSANINSRVRARQVDKP